MSWFWIAIGGTIASLALTGWVRRLAMMQQWLDHPNMRSSHSSPTPRGGGLAIVITSLGTTALLLITQKIEASIALAFIGGGAAVATVGFLDDRRSVSVRARLLVHLAAAMWGVYWLGGLMPIQVGDRTIDLGLLGDAGCVIAIVWVLNLFNFMDGIDGIASSEALFVTAAGAGFQLLAGTAQDIPLIAVGVAAASCGFLLWNWPPAKIFMGDVGSGYLGYVIALLAISSVRDQPAAIFIWAILGGVFAVDATLTLLLRLARRERVYEAHRSHTYQILALRWRGHRPVTLTVCTINTVLLAPVAALAVYRAQWAWLLAALTLGLLAAVWYWARTAQSS